MPSAATVSAAVAATGPGGDPWQKLVAAVRTGAEVEARVLSVNKGGAIVQLADNVRGGKINE